MAGELSSRRLVFGADVLPAGEEVAPAWPTLASIEGRRVAAFGRFLRPVVVSFGGADKPDTEAAREARFRAWAQGAKRTPEYRRALVEGRIRWAPKPAAAPAEAGWVAGPIVSDPVGLSEIAARAGTTPGTVRSWRRRHAGFPAPAVVLAAGPVWSWPIVALWLALERRPGRQAKRAPVPGRHI